MVELDGVARGQTPLEVAGVAGGGHAVRLRLSGYRDLIRGFRMEGDRSERFTLEPLEPLAAQAFPETVLMAPAVAVPAGVPAASADGRNHRLAVYSSQPGWVYVDGRVAGTVGGETPLVV